MNKSDLNLHFPFINNKQINYFIQICQQQIELETDSEEEEEEEYTSDNNNSYNIIDETPNIKQNMYDDNASVEEDLNDYNSLNNTINDENISVNGICIIKGFHILLRFHREYKCDAMFSQKRIADEETNYCYLLYLCIVYNYKLDTYSRNIDFYAFCIS